MFVRKILRMEVKNDNDDLTELFNDGSCCSNCETAAENGHLHCLDYLYNNNHHNFTGLTCEYAAFYGQSHCLEYLHKNGCKLDKQICKMAVRGYGINCIIYLYKHRTESEKDVLYYACKYGKINIVKMLLKINDENIDNEKK